METKTTSIAGIKALAQSIQNLLKQDHSGDFQQIESGLLTSVIRPLGGNGDGISPMETGHGLLSDIDSYLWHLALEATKYMALNPDELGLAEAVARLQRFSLEGIAQEVKEERLVTLKGIQEQLKTRFQTSHNGPYLVTNIPALFNWLGEELPAFPQMALCRCGGSSTKPFCDGTHAANHFMDDKDPKRMSD